jgi:hypothetical protein
VVGGTERPVCRRGGKSFVLAATAVFLAAFTRDRVLANG